MDSLLRITPTLPFTHQYTSSYDLLSFRFSDFSSDLHESSSSSELRRRHSMLPSSITIPERKSSNPRKQRTIYAGGQTKVGNINQSVRWSIINYWSLIFDHCRCWKRPFSVNDIWLELVGRFSLFLHSIDSISELVWKSIKRQLPYLA